MLPNEIFLYYQSSSGAPNCIEWSAFDENIIYPMSRTYIKGSMFNDSVS
jgi:hypothetical protein